MQQEVFENVESLRGEGLTVIMAEQNILGSLMISDRAFVLDLGTKLMEGAAREVLEDPKIKVAFLGADPEEAVE
jgi:branched-chain amino acid transport system ATP-binding protein